VPCPALTTLHTYITTQATFIASKTFSLVFMGCGHRPRTTSQRKNSSIGLRERAVCQGEGRHGINRWLMSRHHRQDALPPLWMILCLAVWPQGGMRVENPPPPLPQRCPMMFLSFPSSTHGPLLHLQKCVHGAFPGNPIQTHLRCSVSGTGKTDAESICMCSCFTFTPQRRAVCSSGR